MATIQPKRLPPLSPKDIERFWSKVQKRGPEDCWLWMSGTSRKYGHFCVYRHEVRVGRMVHWPCIVRAHRVAYFLGHGVDPAPYGVLHHCDNPPCCNPAHFFLGDPKVNALDSKAKGRKKWKPGHLRWEHPELIQRGEQHPFSKLTESDIVEIRRLYATGLWYQREIAERFGIAGPVCCNIINRKAWRHVP